jgi:hypothetical protein
LTSALPDWSSWPREGGDVPAVSCVHSCIRVQLETAQTVLTASRESGPRDCFLFLSEAEQPPLRPNS